MFLALSQSLRSEFNAVSVWAQQSGAADQKHMLGVLQAPSET